MILTENIGHSTLRCLSGLDDIDLHCTFKNNDNGNRN